MLARGPSKGSIRTAISSIHRDASLPNYLANSVLEGIALEVDRALSRTLPYNLHRAGSTAHEREMPAHDVACPVDALGDERQVEELAHHEGAPAALQRVEPAGKG